MPRLVQRQEPQPVRRMTGPTPTCIACGNCRAFWVRRGDGAILAAAWALQPGDTLVACGRCRARNSLVSGWAEE